MPGMGKTDGLDVLAAEGVTKKEIEVVDMEVVVRSGV